jgi:hypothetical protein
MAQWLADLTGPEVVLSRFGEDGQPHPTVSFPWEVRVWGAEAGMIFLVPRADEEQELQGYREVRFPGLHEHLPGVEIAGLRDCLLEAMVAEVVLEVGQAAAAKGRAEPNFPVVWWLTPWHYRAADLAALRHNILKYRKEIVLGGIVSEGLALTAALLPHWIREMDASTCFWGLYLDNGDGKGNGNSTLFKNSISADGWRVELWGIWPSVQAGLREFDRLRHQEGHPPLTAAMWGRNLEKQTVKRLTKIMEGRGPRHLALNPKLAGLGRLAHLSTGLADGQAPFCYAPRWQLGISHGDGDFATLWTADKPASMARDFRLAAPQQAREALLVAARLPLVSDREIPLGWLTLPRTFTTRPETMPFRVNLEFTSPGKGQARLFAIGQGGEEDFLDAAELSLPPAAC